MTPKIVSITFEIDAQSHRDGQFTIPAKVCELLELKPEDDIVLFIETSSATFATIQKLSSGTEIYGPEVSRYVKAGERIRVMAAHP